VDRVRKEQAMPKKIEPLTPVELNRKIEKLKQAGTQA
jgi:hypothetical protein